MIVLWLTIFVLLWFAWYIGGEWKTVHEQDLVSLGQLRYKIFQLFQYLSTTHPDKSVTKNLLARFHADNLQTMRYKTVAIGYTVNKKYITVCTTPESGDDDGELLVLIHELCHMALDDVNHTPLFWETQKWLLQIADKELHLFAKALDGRYDMICGQLVHMT